MLTPKQLTATKRRNAKIRARSALLAIPAPELIWVEATDWPIRSTAPMLAELRNAGAV